MKINVIFYSEILTCWRPFDEIGHVFDVGDVSGSSLDEIPGDEFPVFADGQRKLAGRVDGNVSDAGLEKEKHISQTKSWLQVYNKLLSLF